LEQKIEIQPNEPVKTTHVPNRIGIPTHKGDLGHHILHMKEGTHKSLMELPKGKRGGKKRNKDQTAIMRTNHANLFGMTESLHMN
jgi:hypothetical protein